MDRVSKENMEDLAAKWVAGTISMAEKAKLVNWMGTMDDRELTRSAHSLLAQSQLKTEIWAAIQKELFPAKKRVSISGMRFWVAASIILLLAAGAYLFFRRGSVQSPSLAANQDISAPVNSRARLSVDNGSTIYLEDAGNGTIATLGELTITRNSNGQLRYEGATNSAVYNTLINPRGSKVVDVTLSDGTQVWLNCGSSLRYPASFIGKERVVEISGEAYFEVAANPAKPFKVNKGATQIEILGTRFNVNAYEDEPDLRVTLLEGGLKVSHAQTGLSKLLNPGQQLRVKNSGEFYVQEHADLQQVMAWKDGLFSFRGAEFESVMRDFARWYDLEVIYEGPVPKGKIRGEISKELTLSQILTGLSINKIKYKAEGRKITVLPLHDH